MSEPRSALLDATQTIAIEIEGEWYTFPTRGVAGYQMADISPFTTRTSTGQLRLTDLVGIAAIEQEGFVTGHGQIDFVELSRYAYGDNIWTLHATTGATLGPWIDKNTSIGLQNALTSKFGYHLRAITVSNPFYGSDTATSEDAASSYVFLSNEQKIYCDKVSDVGLANYQDFTGNLLTVMREIPIPNGDFENPVSGGTPNWYVFSSAPSLTGTKSIVTVSGDQRLQLDVSGSSPSIGDRYIVASEYIPIPTDDVVRYSITVDGTLVSGATDWDFYVEVVPVAYDASTGEYKYGVPVSRNFNLVVDGAFTELMNNFTLKWLGTSIESYHNFPRFAEVRLVVEAQSTSPVACQIQYSSVKLELYSTLNVSINDIFYTGMTLLAATNTGIAYCDNFIDALRGATPVWKRSSDFTVGASVIGTFDGYIWYAEEDTAILHFGSDPYGRDLEGRTTNSNHPAYWMGKDSTGLGDIAGVIVGFPDDLILKIHEYNLKLYVFKEESIYYIYNDAGTFVPRKVSTHTYHKANFKNVVYYDGALVYQLGDRVYRFLESSIVDITPPRYYEPSPTPAIEQVTSGLVAHGNLLFAVDEHGRLIVFDGAGWHSVAKKFAPFAASMRSPDHREVVGTVVPVHRSGYDVIVLYDSADGSIYRFGMARENPYPFYSAEQEGVLITSWVDGGLPNIDKHFNSITVEYALESTSYFIEVECAVVDDLGNMRIFDLGTLQADSYTNEHVLWEEQRLRRYIKKINLPKETVGRKIRFRFVLKSPPFTTITGATPHLYRWLLTYVPRPFTIYGYAPTLILTEVTRLRNNATKTWPVEEQVDLLLRARDSRKPIRFKDPITNEIKEAYISAVKIQPLVRRTPVNTNDTTLVAELSLVEFRL